MSYQLNNKISLLLFVGILSTIMVLQLACATELKTLDSVPTKDQSLTPKTNQVIKNNNEKISSTYLSLNQKWIEGLRSDADLDDVDGMFLHVFSKLPEQVTVYPSENYYYFILHVNGKQIWGNIRLAAGRRERGVLSFAYFEFRESPYVSNPRIQRSKFFTDADGLLIDEIDRFTFKVRYSGKEVIFN